MARRARFTVQEQTRTALTAYSRREIAEKLGVSLRTLRRWANEGGKPASADKRAALDALASKSRQAVNRTIRRQGDLVAPTAIPILPERRKIIARELGGAAKGTRQQFTRAELLARGFRISDARKLKSGKYSVFVPELRRSDWSNYNVAGRSQGDMLALMRVAARENRTVQLLVKGPPSTEYPTGIHYTTPMPLYDEMEDDELLYMLEESLGFGEDVLEIGVLDEGA